MRTQHANVKKPSSRTRQRQRAYVRAPGSRWKRRDARGRDAVVTQSALVICSDIQCSITHHTQQLAYLLRAHSVCSAPHGAAKSHRSPGQIRPSGRCAGSSRAAQLDAGLVPAAKRASRVRGPAAGHPSQPWLRRCCAWGGFIQREAHTQKGSRAPPRPSSVHIPAAPIRVQPRGHELRRARGLGRRVASHSHCHDLHRCGRSLFVCL